MKNSFTKDLLYLTLYLFNIRSGENDIMIHRIMLEREHGDEKMTTAYDLEKKVLRDLMREYKSSTEVIGICKKFNENYKLKHPKEHISFRTQAETIQILDEKYNMRKAEVFQRYMNKYYL